MTIQLLPPILANQIAAGEVVERPASVVKELVENSLDAGSSRIELDIDKGGHKRIQIRDNGAGIARSELELALSRHATSKIHSLDDLEHIASLGFRGEALASISSVSRLTLSSKPKQQDKAWQAFAEGVDMAVRIQPVAHPDGTTVEIQDLFFNTPARRKFLRTEKTEFGHIDDVIKRIALSQFDVAFTVRHNGKRVRHYPGATNESARDKRVAKICGDGFMQQALKVDSQYDGLRLCGWLSLERRAQPEHQFVYVNGRMMRDKLINHAIRQVFNEYHPGEDYPGFVLYLTLDPAQVDVNVHPAKHEVRFHQARLVHDFIYRALADGLSRFQADMATPESGITDAQPVNELPAVEPGHDYIRPLQRQVNESPAPYHRQSQPVTASASQNYQQLMRAESPAPARPYWLPVDDHHLLVRDDEALILFPVTALDQQYLISQLSAAPVSQPLLMPVAMALDNALPADFSDHLAAFGVQLQCLPERVLVKQVPAGLRQLDWVRCLSALLDTSWQGDIETFASIVADCRAPLSTAQLESLMRWLSQQELAVKDLPQARRIRMEQLFND